MAPSTENGIENASDPSRAPFAYQALPDEESPLIAGDAPDTKPTKAIPQTGVWTIIAVLLLGMKYKACKLATMTD